MDFISALSLENEIKSASNSLESVSINDTKKKLYGQNINQTKIEKIANDVAEKADFDELAKQSKSFKLFHEQVKIFIEKF